MRTSIQDYENPLEFEFDETKIQVLSGARLIPDIPAPEAYIYTKLDETQGLVSRDTSGNERDGALKGTWDSSDWSTSGKFGNGIEGDSGGRIELSPYGSFERTQAFSLECWFSITSGITQLLISKQKNTTPFSGYAVNIQSGVIFFLIRESVAVRAQIKTANTYNDGVLHHLVVTYDGSSADTGMKIYVDNIQDDVTDVSNTLTGTIINTVKLQISGKDGNNNSLVAGSIINDVVVYVRELSPPEISFRWNSGFGTQTLPGSPASFPTDNPTIISKSFTRATLFDGFAVDFDFSGSDIVKAIIQVNADQFYHNGSAWVLSSGTYSQSNTIAEINTNISTLISDVSDVRPILFLHSDDGSNTPVINDYTLTYEFEGGDEASELSFCTVFWYAFNPDGSICNDEILAVISDNNVKYKNNDFICHEEIVGTPNPITGLIEIALLENVNMEGSKGDPVTYLIKKGSVDIARISVPDQPTALLWNIEI